MNANSVFKHQWLHRAVPRIVPDRVLAIQTRGRDDVDRAEQISGAFAPRDADCFRNHTSSTLITVTTLGLRATLGAAVAARSGRAQP